MIINLAHISLGRIESKINTVRRRNEEGQCFNKDAQTIPHDISDVAALKIL